MITKLKKVLISSNGSLEENFVTLKERFKFNYATSEEVLYTLTDKHPIVPKIIDYKALRKLKSIYVDALPQLINNKNGLILIYVLVMVRDIINFIKGRNLLTQKMVIFRMIKV